LRWYFPFLKKGVIQEQDRHLDFYILRAKGMKIKLDRLEGLAGFEDAVAKTLLRLLSLHGFLVSKASLSFFFLRQTAARNKQGKETKRTKDELIRSKGGKSALRSDHHPCKKTLNKHVKL